MKTRTTRQGFTLVELLVVIAIIGILVSLLLPALGQVREAANSSNCKANLKNVGLAAKAYESRQNKFPAAVRLAQNAALPSGGYGATAASYPVGGATATAPFSFITALLPNLDSSYINDQLDYEQGAFSKTAGSNPKQDATGSDTNNAAVMGSPIPILRCPSSGNDGFSGASEYDKVKDAAGIRLGAALTSYKPVSATNLTILSGTDETARAYTAPSSSPVTGSGGMGLISPYKATRPKSTSMALLLAETDEPTYSAWGDGSTIGLYGVDAGGLVDINKDYSSAGGGAGDGAGDGAGGGSGGSWATSFNGVAISQGVSSAHPNTINVVMGDGSARTIGDDIDVQAWTAFITNEPRDNAAASKYIADNQ